MYPFLSAIVKKTSIFAIGFSFVSISSLSASMNDHDTGESLCDEIQQHYKKRAQRLSRGGLSVDKLVEQQHSSNREAKALLPRDISKGAQVLKELEERAQSRGFGLKTVVDYGFEPTQEQDSSQFRSRIFSDAKRLLKDERWAIDLLILKTAMSDSRLKAMFSMDDETICTKNWATIQERDRGILDKDIQNNFFQAREKLEALQGRPLNILIADEGEGFALGLFRSVFERKIKKIQRQIADYNEILESFIHYKKRALEVELLQSVEDRPSRRKYQYAASQYVPLLQLLMHIKFKKPVMPAFFGEDLFITALNTYNQMHQASSNENADERASFYDALFEFEQGLEALSFRPLSAAESGGITRLLFKRTFSIETRKFVQTINKGGHIFEDVGFLGYYLFYEWAQQIAQLRQSYDRQAFELNLFSAFGLLKGRLRHVVTEQVLHPIDQVTSLPIAIVRSALPLNHINQRLQTEGSEGLISQPLDNPSSENEIKESPSGKEEVSTQVLTSDKVQEPFISSSAYTRDMFQQGLAPSGRVAVPKIFDPRGNEEKTPKQPGKILITSDPRPSPQDLIFSGVTIKDPGYTVTTLDHRYTLSSQSAGFIVVNDQALSHQGHTLRGFNVYTSTQSQGFVRTDTSRSNQDDEQAIELQNGYVFKESSSDTSIR